MMQRAVFVTGILVSLAAPVQSQSAPLLAGDRESNDELARIVESTRQSGLPVDPILAKVRYGVVVAHAPAPRIVAAARAMASRLPVARDALAPDATALDIIAGEGALANGANKEALQAVRAASGNRPVANALGVLAQLVASGVSSERASETVVALIKRGASSEQLATLGNSVNLDVASGALATTALDVRMRGLTAVLAPLGTGFAAADAAAPTTQGKKP